MRRTVISCDRCGDEIPKPAQVTRVESDRPVLMVGDQFNKAFDLCGDCGGAFINFIKGHMVRATGPMSSNM